MVERETDNQETEVVGNVVSFEEYRLNREHGRMFKIEEVAPRNETKTKEFSILGSKAEVEYYRNRLTLENDLSALARARAQEIAGEQNVTLDAADLTSWEVATRLELIVKSWNLTGPLRHPITGDVLVDDGQPIPVRAEIIKSIPLRIIRPLNQAIIDEELGGGNDEAKQKP